MSKNEKTPGAGTPEEFDTEAALTKLLDYLRSAPYSSESNGS